WELAGLAPATLGRQCDIERGCGAPARLRLPRCYAERDGEPNLDLVWDCRWRSRSSELRWPADRGHGRKRGYLRVHDCRERIERRGGGARGRRGRLWRWGWGCRRRHDVELRGRH